MSTQKLTAIILVGIAFALASTPGEAAKKKPVEAGQRVASVGHPARVTVRKRSFLDPGTATPPGGEHNLDYAFPIYGGSRNPTNNLNLFNFGFDNRMPIPTCFDVPGMCGR
jgi:hypothetical protein